MNRTAPQATEVSDMTLGVYRRVYAGSIDDRRLAGVSIGAEAWMTRVLLASDDFGNATGDPVVLFTKTAGRRLVGPNAVTVDQVTAWVQELVGAGLLLTYEVAGEWYVHIADFDQRQPGPRNGKRIRKVPASPFDGGGNGPTEDNGADAAGASRGIQMHPVHPNPPIPIPIPRPRVRRLRRLPARPLRSRRRRPRRGRRP